MREKLKLIIKVLGSPEVRGDLFDLASELAEMGAASLLSSKRLPGQPCSDAVDHPAPGIESSSRGGYDGFVPYGRQKTNGGHDHRFNKGEDRTPAQKSGDERRRKS
ncbi:hypothetical protein PSCICO_31950 [Pseudomonas cichorii]|nr:hypothetical protein PSCICO_31950 [Pseudomonas cichorii]